MSWSSGLSRDGDSLCCARLRQLRARSDGARHLSQHLGVQGAVPEAGTCQIHCEGGYQSHSGADHGAVLDYHLFTVFFLTGREKFAHCWNNSSTGLLLFFFFFLTAAYLSFAFPAVPKEAFASLSAHPKCVNVEARLLTDNETVLGSMRGARCVVQLPHLSARRMQSLFSYPNSELAEGWQEENVSDDRG